MENIEVGFSDHNGQLDRFAGIAYNGDAYCVTEDPDDQEDDGVIHKISIKGGTADTLANSELMLDGFSFDTQFKATIFEELSRHGRLGDKSTSGEKRLMMDISNTLGDIHSECMNRRITEWPSSELSESLARIEDLADIAGNNEDIAHNCGEIDVQLSRVLARIIQERIEKDKELVDTLQGGTASQVISDSVTRMTQKSAWMQRYAKQAEAVARAKKEKENDVQSSGAVVLDSWNNPPCDVLRDISVKNTSEEAVILSINAGYSAFRANGDAQAYFDTIESFTKEAKSGSLDTMFSAKVAAIIRDRNETIHRCSSGNLHITW
jgi:hypothetical protein